MDTLRQTIEFIRDPQNTYLQHTIQFLTVCVVAVVLAFVISIPLGIAVARRPVGAFLAANLSGLARAVPTIVFLFLVVPILGIGFLPAVLALTVIGIPPILLNTIAGLRGVDPAAIDAARGVGMTWLQVLTRVTLPLALPVIAAGVRISAVQIVATAPLAAETGAGGYGDYILAGINLLQTPPLIAGAVPVAVLALLIEFGLGGLQTRITPVGIRTAPASQQAVPVEESLDAPALEPTKV